MPNIEIGRLVIDAPGLSQDQGIRLGQIVAKRLAARQWRPAADLPRLEIGVSAPAHGSELDSLADEIVRAVQRRLT